ncbi:DUF2634 domain-containing protein [Clostridium sp.]|uniref:DUF2634 domain-containing protein n=1 Tax=Clostridium sp. TaxID=1506 RepID=UPI0025BBBBC6|nr:DUF2634 domain-containing protein [Clostridium sp.]MBS4958403.1 DUF2634 domain-containing protein [Clostridium sp.]MDU3526407.1 DUF2634 domain-containing protein [Clostridium sp.]
MIPTSKLDSLEIVDNIETSKTYRIIDNSLNGYVDELESLKQAIYKVLNTERYEYPIYSFNYGIELESLIGKDADYVKIEFKRRIEECLLEDERVKEVNNFEFIQDGESLICSFYVISIYGEISITKEVDI